MQTRLNLNLVSDHNLMSGAMRLVLWVWLWHISFQARGKNEHDFGVFTYNFLYSCWDSSYPPIKVGDSPLLFHILSFLFSSTLKLIGISAYESLSFPVFTLEVIDNHKKKKPLEVIEHGHVMRVTLTRSIKRDPLTP